MMNKITKSLLYTSLSITFLGLIGCTGGAVGVNKFKPEKPTELFSALEPSLYSTDEGGELVKELIREYQKYGALILAVESESPNYAEDTCYEWEDKTKNVEPLLEQQHDLLVHIQSLYKKLETLEKGNLSADNAVEAGRVYITTANHRVQKHNDLVGISKSMIADCPGGLAVLFPVLVGLPSYFSARGKSPAFNQTASELEELSAQEKKLASNVVQSLMDFRPRTSEGGKEPVTTSRTPEIAIAPKVEQGTGQSSQKLETAYATKPPAYKGNWSLVEAPVYKNGDWWVFRYKEKGHPAEEYRVTYKHGRFESDDPYFLTESLIPLVSVNIKDPERKWLNFPLSPRKKWSFRYPNLEGAAGSTMSVPPPFRDAEAEVIGPVPQPLETPAGKFKVVEIQGTDSARGKYELVYFYSPETKSVVKFTAHSRRYGDYEMELIKYSSH